MIPYKFKGEFDDEIFYIKAENATDAIKYARESWGNEATLIGIASDEEEKDIFWFEQA